MSVFFSIIIPTYNSSDTLSTSLDSVLSQTFKDYEIVIMDGVSTDDTLEIATRFQQQDSRVRIHSESDNGIYDAMNKGIDKAKGDWVIFLGSDDALADETVLERVAEHIRKTNALVVYGNVRIHGDSGWAKDGDIYDGEFTLEKLLNQNICHQAMFYNRKFIKEEVGSYNEAYFKSSDWDFNLRCWAKRPLEYMDLIVADFKAGGVSTDSTDHKFNEDYVDNLLTYFRIGLFHPLINRPTFILYARVLEKQRKKHPLRYGLQRLFRKR